MRNTTFAMSLLLIAFGTERVARADSYTYATFAVPGASYTQAIGINDQGQISGWYTGSTGAYGFVYSNGSYTSIDGPHAPGDVNNRVSGINNLGQVVGFVINDPAGNPTGFLDTGGAFTTINFPGTSYTTATGINDSGEIVGGYRDSSRGYGYLFTPNGVYLSLNVPGSTSTMASGINDLGQVVGTFSNSTGSHSFLYSNGTYTVLPDISGFAADGINDAGQIAGGSGVLNVDGSFSALSVPGYSQSFATGINDLGQVVGYVNAASGQASSFIATPTTVPEPAAFSMVFIAMGCFGGLRFLRAKNRAAGSRHSAS